MRVGFAGTPAFAARAMAAIVESGYTIPLCLTQPDRPKGRGLKLEPSPVKALAQSRGIPVGQPASLKTAAALDRWLAVALDVLVVAAYGLILPQRVLDWPRHGCLNIHASRLPRWRGAAPIQRAIEAGDASTGVTIMRMDAGLDTGPIVDAIDVPISPRETGGTLHDKLASAGARMIVEVLARLARDGTLHARPQPETGVRYAAKISDAETRVDWREPAIAIERRIRAFDPVPGLAATLANQRLKLWAAEIIPAAPYAAPGTVIAAGRQGIDVACGSDETGGALRLLEVQPAGRGRMSAAAFVAGRAIAPGVTFTAGAV
jgi:methionyl-tRNA formyltransferase